MPTVELRQAVGLGLWRGADSLSSTNSDGGREWTEQRLNEGNEGKSLQYSAHHC